MNTILPIGSVVMLKGGTKPVMIFGYLQQSAYYGDDVVDYVGVPYPEGNINIAVQMGFQMTDISEVLFEGYRTEAFDPWDELLTTASARHLIKDGEKADETAENE